MHFFIVKMHSFTSKKSKFRSQRFVHLVVPIPKRCDTTPLPQNPPEEIDRDAQTHRQKRITSVP